MDVEALERLDAFVMRHGRCEEQGISTEFVEDGDANGIHVIKRCQSCNAMIVVTVSKGIAMGLLRQ